MFRIEEMALDDLPEVLEIERMSLPDPWTEGMFMIEMSLSHSRTRVARVHAKDREKVAGYICYWYVADEVHVLDLAVHPAYRRMGVGRQLMDDLIGDAREKKAVCVQLEVRESNAAAFRFYRGLGFTRTGTRRKYYHNPPEDAILMTLEPGDAPHALAEGRQRQG